MVGYVFSCGCRDPGNVPTVKTVPNVQQSDDNQQLAESGSLCCAAAGNERERPLCQGSGVQPVCEHHQLAEGEAGSTGLWLSYHLGLHDSAAQVTGKILSGLLCPHKEEL